MTHFEKLSFFSGGNLLTLLTSDELGCFLDNGSKLPVGQPNRIKKKKFNISIFIMLFIDR